MPRPKSKINNKPSEYIEENFLKDSPEGLPPMDEDRIAPQIVVSRHIPKMEKVIFLNGRDPGETLYFHFASATHPLKIYTLYHGQEVDLPVEVIKNLEECNTKNYGYKVGRSGHPECYVKSVNYIFTCKPVRKAA
jgi:hypothetical protein